MYEWECNQRSLSGGRGWEVRMRPCGRKESNTLEGQGESQCVWNTGAVGMHVVMTLGEIMQGPYRSCGRIFISTLREWEKPLKCFKQVSEGIWCASGKRHAFHGKWVGWGETCTRRDHLGDGSPCSGCWPWAVAVAKDEVDLLCFRGKTYETDMSLPQGWMWGSSVLWAQDTGSHWWLGKKITTCVRTADWLLPSCRTLGESCGLPCTLVLFSD